MTDRVDLLIDILLDPSAREDERSDAAMDLGEYSQDDRALEALARTASNPHEDAGILDDCAESMAEIFIQQKNVRKDILCALDPLARWYAINYIKARKPEWIEEYDLEKLLE